MMGGVLEIRKEDVLKLVRCVSAVSFRKPVGSSGCVKFNQQISPTSVTEESWRTVELHYYLIDSVREQTQKKTTRFYCLCRITYQHLSTVEYCRTIIYLMYIYVIHYHYNSYIAGGRVNHPCL